jgi:hypothetical protein
VLTPRDNEWLILLVEQPEPQARALGQVLAPVLESVLTLVGVVSHDRLKAMHDRMAVYMSSWPPVVLYPFAQKLGLNLQDTYAHNDFLIPHLLTVMSEQHPFILSHQNLPEI